MGKEIFRYPGQDQSMWWRVLGYALDRSVKKFTIVPLQFESMRRVAPRLNHHLEIIAHQPNGSIAISVNDFCFGLPFANPDKEKEGWGEIFEKAGHVATRLRELFPEAEVVVKIESG